MHDMTNKIRTWFIFKYNTYVTLLIANIVTIMRSLNKDLHKKGYI